jgi:predicted GIY-YIG superfamily endonuclease
VTLVYVEQMQDRSAAMRREIALKKLSRPQKRKLIDKQDNHR